MKYGIYLSHKKFLYNIFINGKKIKASELIIRLRDLLHRFYDGDEITLSEQIYATKIYLSRRINKLYKIEEPLDITDAIIKRYNTEFIEV